MTRARALAVALLACALACGSRTPLEGASAGQGSDGGGGSGGSGTLPCTPDAGRGPPTMACTTWVVAGDDHVLAPAPPEGTFLNLSAPIASGCGVLVGWSTTSGRDAMNVTWSTRSILFDGTPRTDVFAHPGLAAQSRVSSEMSLAAGRARAAAVVAQASGCRFAPLDLDGADAAPVTELGNVGCSALAPDGDGFSYLTPSAGSVTPVALHRVDANGAPRDTVTLAATPGRAVWGRLVLDDGTFLLDTFFEASTYADWLQRFNAHGAALGKENVVPGATTAPVLLAQSASGVLATWQWSANEVVPMDRDGNATGPARSYPKVGQPFYGSSLVAMPNGDVLLLWVEDGSGTYELYARVLAPDGSARAPATTLRTRSRSSRFYVVMDSSGARAVLVYVDEGVKATPLGCGR